MSATTERGLNALRGAINSHVASYFASCVHCGLCAEACLFHTETGDPRYTPIYKVEPLRRLWQQEYTLLGRIGRWLRLTKPVDDAMLEKWQALVYNSCTLCGRCSMVCPVGNDIAYLIRQLREGMSAAGYAPTGMVDATRRTVEVGSPMGVRLPALQAQMRHVEAETGIAIPIDQPDVEYLVLLSSMEVINFPEYLAAIARIMQQAGKRWTLCSTAFEATNAGIQIGQSDLARTIVQRIVDGAEQLRVKTVISPECGHAFTALRWEGPNLIGRPYRFEVLHILELLDQLRRDGLLRTEGMASARMSFHDPCQIARRGGVIEPQRNLMKMVAADFVELPDAGRMNWCCGGGGGNSAIEEAHPLRMQAFNVKKRQLEAAAPETLVTACANCRITLEEGLEHHHLDLPVVGLTELIADHLICDPAPEVSDDQ